MVKIGFVGNENRRQEIESMLNSKKDWTYVGYYDFADEQTFIPKSAKGIKTDFEIFLNNTDAIYFNDEKDIPFVSIELALKNSKHVYIGNTRYLSVDEANRLKKLFTEIKTTCTCGKIFPLKAEQWVEKLVPKTPKIVQVLYGKDLNYDNVNDILIEQVDLVYRMIKSECRKTQALGISAVHSYSDTLDANILFANGSVANILIHPPFPRNEHKVFVFQQHGLVTFDLLQKSYCMVSGHHEDSGGIQISGPMDVLSESLDDFKEEINRNNKMYVLEERLAPVYIYHSLFEKIKRTSGNP